MILQKFIQSCETPPGKFTFVCPETGYEISELSKEDMFAKMQKHYVSNNLTLPENWKALVEDRICQRLPPGWCQYIGGKEAKGQGCTVTAEMIIHGIKCLANLVWSKLKGEDIFASQEEAEARAEICAKCNLNVGSSICMGCGAMSEVIKQAGKIKGKRQTKWDSFLKTCCRCGCRNETTVHIKKEILTSCDNEADMLKYPEWCWKRESNLTIAKNKLSL